MAESQREKGFMIRVIACAHILCLMIETSTTLAEFLLNFRKKSKKTLAKRPSLKYNSQARQKNERIL